MRLGLIGAGTIARFHAEAAVGAATEIAGVCDTDAGRAEALASEHAGAVATTSVDELLATDGLDAVVVAVPNHLHKPCAVAALRAGKDVLLEKPMAMSTAECDEIMTARRESGRIVQMGFVSRYAPAAAAARRLVEGGRLGRVYHARVQWYRRRGIPGLGGWFTSREQSGGGVLIDLGVHLIDLALDLAGRPRPRRASGVSSATFGTRIDRYAFTEMWAGPPRPDGVFDVEDLAAGLLRCDGGFALEVSVAWAANVSDEESTNRVILLGDEGGCCFDVWGRGLRLTTEMNGLLVDVEPSLAPGEPWTEAWRGQHEAFARAVASREPPRASAEHGREVQGVVEALYRSAGEGREVEVDGGDRLQCLPEE